MGLRRDLAVEGADGSVAVDLTSSWDFTTPNGGFLAALCMSAAANVSRVRVPASVASTFTSSPRSGRSARLDVEVLRSTARVDVVGVDLLHDDRRMTRTTVWMRGADGDPGLPHDVAEMPAHPPPSDVPTVSRSGNPRKAFPFWNNVEERRLPSTDARPEWIGWYRFTPEAKFADPVLDSARALILLDVLALPAAVTAHPSQFALATTLQTNVLFCGSPDALDTEWLLVHMSAPVSRDGFIHAHGTVWSEKGALLALGQTTMMFIGPVVERGT